MTKTTMSELRVLPGKNYPLGAACDENGVNFALFAGGAEKVELCLFESPQSAKEHERIVMPLQTEGVWHCYVPGLKAGQVYGYRVFGPYLPLEGMRFNPHKLLLDPYARSIVKDLEWSDALFGWNIRNEEEKDLSFSTADSVRVAPRGEVTAEERAPDTRPFIPWSETIIYETHVKGISALHPDVAPELRGTYLGLAAEPVVAHLKQLGVTAVELLPIQYSVTEGHLRKLNLTNYWGYSTLGYFAPDPRYAAQGTKLSVSGQFQAMVQALHAAGIEVILDIVFNHTCEGSERGPTLSWRGIDNAAYYRLQRKHPRFYDDASGCGNTLKLAHPRVLQFVMDCLRYWVQTMNVDGFRFDLATALGREENGFDPGSGFFDAILQDPVLSQAKLIAEPWDIGEEGYRVGGFPVNWHEWNDKFRASMRAFWRGDDNMVPAVATRIAGSSDLFKASGRGPLASINFVTAHDGFTLRDVVSYSRKHNLANGEDNRDGENNNLSWNCGVEGSTSDKKVMLLRERSRRNLIASLFLSNGVPMMLGADELGKTQLGNNNAYCQDNKLSWHNWKLVKEDQDFLHFVQELIKIRRQEPVFRRETFFSGMLDRLSGEKDIIWYSSSGEEFADDDWSEPKRKHFGVFFSGKSIAEIDSNGETREGSSFLMLLSAEPKTVNFILPRSVVGSGWELLFDTSLSPSFQGRNFSKQKRAYDLKSHSFVLLRRI